MSRKRILPAFVLCFLLCGHRIYAGRYLTGIAQFVLVSGSGLWVEIACKDLIAIVKSGALTMDMVERIGNWEETHQMPFIPMVILLVVGLWVAIDAAKLVTGKFKDGQGSRITKWI